MDEFLLPGWCFLTGRAAELLDGPPGRRLCWSGAGQAGGTGDSPLMVVNFLTCGFTGCFSEHLEGSGPEAPLGQDPDWTHWLGGDRTIGSPCPCPSVPLSLSPSSQEGQVDETQPASQPARQAEREVREEDHRHDNDGGHTSTCLQQL